VSLDLGPIDASCSHDYFTLSEQRLKEKVNENVLAFMKS
jgi:hypothetical protein